MHCFVKCSAEHVKVLIDRCFLTFGYEKARTNCASVLADSAEASVREASHGADDECCGDESPEVFECPGAVDAGLASPRRPRRSAVRRTSGPVVGAAVGTVGHPANAWHSHYPCCCSMPLWQPCSCWAPRRDTGIEPAFHPLERWSGESISGRKPIPLGIVTLLPKSVTPFFLPAVDCSGPRLRAGRRS